MKKLSFVNKIIYVINVIVAVALLLSFILSFLPPTVFYALSVINLGVPFLILINVLFFVYWFIRLKRQMILSLILLIFSYAFFGSFYKFSSPKEIAHDHNIKIMNYNVRLFNLYNWIPKDSLEVKIVDFIKKEAPEVLCIQEYHPHKNINLSFFKYKFEKLSGKKTKYGQAIFSQYPIINSGSVEFPNTANNAIYTDIVKGKDTMRIYNIHLESLKLSAEVHDLKKENSEILLNRIDSTFKTQQYQAELFLKHKKQCPYKMVICGDFNNTAFSYVYRKIKGDLQDAFKEIGSGFGRTYDFKLFPVRIDFVLADKAFTVDQFQSYSERYSDHYPIMATFGLKP